MLTQRIPTAKLAELFSGHHDFLLRINRERPSIGTKIVNLFYGEGAPAASATDQGGGGGPASSGEQGEPLVATAPPTEQREDPLEVPQPHPTLRRQKAIDFDHIDLSMLASMDTDTAGLPDIVNPKIWWRHPLLRLVAIWSVLFLDFFIYGVDPAQDSHVLYPFFGVFEDLFVIKWPQRLEYQICRIAIFIIVSMFSFWFGRFVVHHKFLRDFCGLSMFSGSKGTLLVNCLVYTIFFEAVLPIPVNYIESGTMEEPVTEASVLRYMDWGKIWQTLAAVADTLAIVTITDTVMQDRRVWPEFAPRFKRIWNDVAGGWVRVIMAWAGFFIMLPLIVGGLWLDDSTNGIYKLDEVMSVHTAQWMRVGIAAILTCVDITTVLQDWEFPSFNAPVDFMIVGSFQTTLDVPCLTHLTRPISKLITCIPEDFWEIFHFQMSGKWLAYMPAFGSLAVDLYYMCRTIFSFHPLQFGEYHGPEPDCWLYVVVNETVLDGLYGKGFNESTMSGAISWETRKGEFDDVQLTSRFCGNHDYLTVMFLCVGLLSGIAFIALIIRAEYYWDNYFSRNKEGLPERIMSYNEGQRRRSGVEDDLTLSGGGEGDAEAEVELRVTAPSQ